jgi:phosphoribosylamine--glycine ligase
LATCTSERSGTRRDDQRLITDGGRVLGVTALGSDIRERNRAYAAVDRIDWPEGFCRRDIGRHALGE